jgi:glutathione synthase
VQKTGYVVVQEWLPAAAHGEKRMLLLAGEPIREKKEVAIYRRLAPANGSRARGTRKACELGKAEQRIVDVLGPKLVSDGLYFVSIDVCGDKVVEVNVFTPGGIHTSNELYDMDVGDVVVRDLERRIAVRQAYRKSLERVA